MGGLGIQKCGTFHKLIRIHEGKYMETLKLKNRTPLIMNCFPSGSAVKNPSAAKEIQETWFHPCVGKIPWRTKRQPTAVFLPGKPHGQRSLVGYSPWGHEELDMTENTAQDINSEQHRFQLCGFDYMGIFS